MAGVSSSLTFIQRHLFLLGLFALFAAFSRAETGLDRCPDYVANHAPLVWLHSDDPFKPSDVLSHIRHTTPWLDGQPIKDLPSLDLDNLEILNKFGYKTALSSNDDPTTFPAWLFGEAPNDAGQIRNSTPCVVILVEKSEVDLDAFYFYFYSYNEGPNITQVLEPIDSMVTGSKAKGGMHFGDHVGDWEHNMVRFQDGKPVGIYYSQHVDGEGYDWDHSLISKVDERPIVYSARGTHANYPAPGDQIHNAAIIDYCDEGQKWDPILSADFYHFEPSTHTLTRLLAPGESSSSPTSNLTSFLYYNGRWGDVEYPDSDPRQENIKKFGVKRFRTGPTGPLHKRLVRKGLLPDQKRRLGWKEWALGWYLALYPCCIKGWRAWASISIIVLIFVGLVLGIWFGVRRLRRGRGQQRKYTKLHGDEILLDDWVRDEEALFSDSEEEETEHHR